MTERDRLEVLERFRHIAEADSRIVAAFLGGSLAAGTADTYSDIDIYFVIDPPAYDGLRSEVASMLKDFGPLVFFDQHSDFGFDLFLFMFKNGVKGELGLGTTRNLKDMHIGPFKILIDKTGLLSKMDFPLPRPLSGKSLQEYVEKQLRWYWYWYAQLLTSCARNRLWSAELALSTMRERAFTLLKLAFQPNHHPEGMRFEPSIPASLQTELGRTLASYSPTSFRSCARTLTKIVKNEIRSVLAASDAKYPSELEKMILSKSQATE
jgi:hypothetical protein